jgi:hypothetical protein
MQENTHKGRLLEMCNTLAAHLAEIRQRVESAKVADTKRAESGAGAKGAKAAELRT